jgi:hypothetical protein
MKSRMVALAAILLSIVIYACRKDLSDAPEPVDSFILQAKDYYYKTALKTISLPSTKGVAGEAKIIPLWSKGFSSKTKVFEFVEVPVIANKKQVAIFNFEKKNSTKEGKASQSFFIFSKVTYLSKQTGRV